MTPQEKEDFAVILGGYCISICIVLGVAMAIWWLLKL